MKKTSQPALQNAISPVSFWLAGLYGFFTISHWLVLSADIAPIMMAIAGGSACFLALLGGYTRRHPVPLPLVYPVASVFTLVIGFNSLIHLWLVQEPYLVTNIGLLLISIGIFFLDTRWFVVNIVATHIAFIAFMSAMDFSNDWQPFIFFVIEATMVSVIAHLVRRRNFDHLTVLRHQAENRSEQTALVAKLATENEQRFRRLADATFEGIVLYQDDKIFDANLVLANMFGYQLHEIIGRPIYDFITPQLWSNVKDYLNSVNEGTYEVIAQHKDGTEFFIEVRGRIISYRPLVRIAVVRDITSYKETEQVLQRAKRAAEEASLAKSNFLANMSHELRTPLTAIMGYAELIHEESEDQQLKQIMNDSHKIIIASQHLLTIINDILDIAKIETQRLRFTLSKLHVPQLVHEVCSTVQPRFETNNNKFHLKMADDVNIMYVDEAKLRQMLVNLLDNATKFTHNGQITLSVSSRDEGYLFDVADNGIGIESDKLATLFEAFTQADQSHTRKYGGTGLGLAITRRLCDIMGGSISVETEPGQGSTFSLWLPAHVQISNDLIEAVET